MMRFPRRNWLVSKAAMRTIGFVAGAFVVAGGAAGVDLAAVGCSSSSSGPTFDFGDSSVGPPMGVGPGSPGKDGGTQHPGDSSVNPSFDSSAFAYDGGLSASDAMMLIPLSDATPDIYVACPSGPGCQTCCENAHGAGANTYLNALLNCVCGATGTDGVCPPCATEACMGTMPAPGDTCSTCGSAAIADGGACVMPVVTACNANPDCQAFQACIATPNCM